MILTITYRQNPATDLGYLLHKNPSRPQTVDISFGKAHIFYPVATQDECTAALLLDINPVDLARGKKDSRGEGLFDYVNDRPYVASSFLSVAIAKVFGTALSGKSKEKQELAGKPLPFTAEITMLPSRGGEGMIRRLFEPLGYTVEVKGYALDEKFEEWGPSRFFTVKLDNTCCIKDLLNHIYILVPVLDMEKHYWVGSDEVEKLVRHASTWLSSHPDKELITNRYLKKKKHLISEALSRLIEEEEFETLEAEDVVSEDSNESALNLNEQRMGTVVSVLKNLGAESVIDMGCGEGRLLERLLKEKQFRKISGMDVSFRILEKAQSRLKLDRLAPMQKERIFLFQSSLTYRDKRYEGFDAAAIIEVIEHLDVHRLATFERVLFEFAKPKSILITTPNKEYNDKYQNLFEGDLRHGDHRFEWTRNEFETWSNGIAKKYGYSIKFLSIGEEDPLLGAPTQMGVFTQ